MGSGKLQRTSDGHYWLIFNNDQCINPIGRVKYRILLCNEKRTKIFVKSLVLAFLGGVLIH